MPDFLPSLWDREDGGRDPMRSMRREIDRLFDDFANRTPASWFGSEGLSPRIDVSETDSGIEVTAELPGVEEKDINVDLAGDMLTISGEKKQEAEEKKKNYHRVERSYGSFRRSMSLPFDVDPDKVTANFDKGVLKVSLPKPPEAQKKTKKIAVKAAKSGK